MLPGEDLINCRIAARLEVGRVRKGGDVGPRPSVNGVCAVGSMYGHVAQKGVDDGAQGRDLHLDVGRGVRARHRHFTGSLVRFASTKVAAWAGRASDGCGPLTIASRSAA